MGTTIPPPSDPNAGLSLEESIGIRTPNGMQPRLQSADPWPFKRKRRKKALAIITQRYALELGKMEYGRTYGICHVCGKQCRSTHRLPILAQGLAHRRSLHLLMQGGTGRRTPESLSMHAQIEQRYFCSLECYASALIHRLCIPITFFQFLYFWITLLFIRLLTTED